MKDIDERIQRLRREVFILEMKDTMDNADYSLLHTLNKEIKQLEEQRDLNDDR